MERVRMERKNVYKVIILGFFWSSKKTVVCSCPDRGVRNKERAQAKCVKNSGGSHIVHQL